MTDTAMNTQASGSGSDVRGLALDVVGSYVAGIGVAAEIALRAVGAAPVPGLGAATTFAGMLMDGLLTEGALQTSGDIGRTAATAAAGAFAAGAIAAYAPAAFTGVGVAATVGLTAAATYFAGQAAGAAYDYAKGSGAFDQAAELGQQVFDSIAQAAQDVANEIGNGLSEAADIASNLYDAATQYLGEAAQTLSDPNFYQGLMNSLSDAAAGLGQYLQDNLDRLGNALNDLFNPGGDAPSSDDPVPPGTPDGPSGPNDPGSPNDPGAPQQPAPYVPGGASGMGGAANMISPLVLDLDGDGIELRSKVSSTAFFDLNADGFAEQTGWVRADDGLLALDRNGNNRIDNITELFGNAITDGFVILKTLDTNHDNKIDASDVDFGGLRVWKDANQDGVSQYWELRKLADLEITGINLAATNTNQSIEGNRISSVSSYTRADGTSRTIVDAWFVNDKINTKYGNTYQLNIQAALMPFLRGYGSVPNLHVALSQDPTLLSMVKELIALTPKDAGLFDERIAAIMYRWAGVDGIDPASRGAYVDARHLAFLERYFNQPFVQTGVGPNPRWNAGAALEDTWCTVFTEVKARLLIQGPLATLFPFATYSLKTDTLVGVDVNAAIDAVAAQAPSTGISDLVRFWAALVPVFDVLGTDVLPGVPYQDHLLSAIRTSGLDAALSDLQSLASRHLTGTSGADSLTGTKAAEFIAGSTGDDTLAGNGGNDLYFFARGDGSDSVIDSGGDTGDVIQFGPGIVKGDITVSRAGGGFSDLVLSINGTTDKITVVKHFSSSTYRIDEVRFDDGSVWTYQDLLNMLLTSTSGNDSLYGDDTANLINGGAGNDYIEGRGGADTLDGGGGADTLYGGADADLYLFGRGSGQDRIHDNDSDTTKLDTLQFAADVTPGDVTVSRTSNDLALGIGGTTDKVTLANYFYSASYRIERIAFADGTVWNYDAMFNRLVVSGTDGNDSLYGDDTANLINGGAGNDYIEGRGGADTLDGGGGADTLYGGADADLYLFGRGSGQDRIHDNDSDTTKLDTLQFAADVTPGDVTVSRTSNDLALGIGGTTDKVTLANYFYSASYRIERIAFADGTVWNYGAVFSWLLVGTSGNDSLYGDDTANLINGGAGNDYIEGRGGADTLDGGGGADTLYGGADADLYLFGRGSGQDRIHDNDSDTTKLDTLQFAADVTPGDVTVSRTSNDLALGIGGTTDKVTLANYFYSASYRIERIAFADGTMWNYDTVQARSLIGSSTNDSIVGFSGDDRLEGWAGNDTLDGGAGNDTLDGGAGNDSLLGGTNSDSYLINRGGSQDVVNNTASDAATATDRVVFGSDIACNQLWLTQVGNDLQVSIIGTADKVTIAGWYSNANNQVDEFDSGDGKVMTASRVQQLVNAMAQFSPPSGASTHMASDIEQALAPNLADSWRPAA